MSDMDQASGHPSTWAAEVEALRKERDDLIERYSALSDKYAQLSGDYCNRVDVVSSLQARVAELENIAAEYLDALRSAGHGPDLHCGYFTAKGHRFRKDLLQDSLQRVEAALKGDGS